MKVRVTMENQFNTYWTEETTHVNRKKEKLKICYAPLLFTQF